MRLPILDHTTLQGDQKALYEDMKSGIEKNFKGFTAIDEKADLVGPWNPWLSFPKFGGPVWNLVKALADNPQLPKTVREIAILVTGTYFHSDYELYAHIHVAEDRGLSEDTIRTIVSGNRPHDLPREEAMAYDFASILVEGGVIPEILYRGMVETFGQDGTAEFIYLVGLYCMVSTTLNGFNVPVPQDGDA
ncbi:carboxymuconolactone decarboxylase family protein [Novosphingobium sp. 9]|uniref:carboxymuconolactone decarboxylase family protein n=1 Tax=Novosphingobium sp. 9 TaxID=2025349 RepID=UPI0021B55C0E|nr:carboxymuconolactone decarboxylase family protein [Novosphingobium sp. 9]